MQRKALWGTAGVTLLYLLAFAFNVTPYLRGPQAWRWAYAIPGYPWRHLLPTVVVAVYTTIALSWSRKLHQIQPSHRQSSVTLFLFFLALAIPLIQAALLFPESPDVPRPLFYRTVSAGASGVFSVGTTIVDPVDFVRRYPELMPTFPVHPQRYPPGLPLLFYAARQALQAVPAGSEPLGLALRLYQCHDFTLMRLSNATIATALLQMALPAVMGLIVFPLYGLARRTVGERAALWATMAYPLVPSLALWSARWDQFYPLLTCAAWYCFWRGLANGESRITNHRSRITPYVWLLSSGLLLAGASFLSFGPLALLAPLGLSALLWALPYPERRQWAYLALKALVFFTGLIVPWLVYQVAFGSGFLDIWRVSMAYHLGLGRNYWTWLVFHLYDFLAFLGVPLAIGLVAGVGYAVWDVRCKQDTGVTPLAFAFGLLLLNVSGAAQGEVARVWLFLTPFATIAAAYGLSRLASKHHHGTLLLVLLALHLLVFNAYLRVVTTGVTDPPARERAFSLDADIRPIDAEFGDGIALLGYEVEPEPLEPGSTLRLTLYWQAKSQMTQPYNVFTHLFGPDGDLLAQQDNMPLHDRAPTTCWVPGEIIADDYALNVPAQARPGTYTLVVGLYVWQTGARLPARGAHTTPDDVVVLTTFVESGISTDP
jgi:hypothetical protein